MSLRPIRLGILGCFLLLEAACAHHSPNPQSSGEHGPSLVPEFPVERSRAFKKALKAEAGSTTLEQARIEYLLDRVSKSPYNFIRNNSRYTGKRAEAHLKWKRMLNRLYVKTGEDFIHRVAGGSKRSGKAYLVEIPEKKRYPLQTLLREELENFDRALAQAKQPVITAGGDNPS